MEDRELWHPISLSCCHNLKSSGKMTGETKYQKRRTKIGEEADLRFKQANKYILVYVLEPDVTIIAW